MPLRVFHSPEDWSAHFGATAPRTAVTVGSFDGLHLGHVELLRGVVERARQGGLAAAAITFDPHPLKVLHPEKAPPMLATLAQRLKGFEELGLDAALVMKFDVALSHVSAEDFVQRILAETLHVALLRVGENFRFGHRHAGDVPLLQRLGAEFGFEVEIVPPVVVRGTVVSSTAIRHALREGRVHDAARLLGRPFVLTGAIESGTGRGRRLVVPTLNLAPEQEMLPKAGVYATETVVDGRRHPSVTNVGFRPTFDGKHLTIESHLLEFPRAAQVSAGSMEVHFLRRLRDEKKFRSPEALQAQIRRDAARATSLFKRLARTEARIIKPHARRRGTRRTRRPRQSA